jgi:hypothetical protein
MSQRTYAYYRCHFGNIFDWAALANALGAAREATGGHCG